MTPVIPPVVITILITAWAGFGLYLVLQLARPRWLRDRGVLQVLFQVGFLGHAKALAVRIPHQASLLLFSYLSLHAFGVNVPATQVILLMPLV
jgi:hypothetical protein